jgi:hypothetical protein
MHSGKTTSLLSALAFGLLLAVPTADAGSMYHAYNGTIIAANLHAEYERNQVDSDAKYQNLHASVVGTVEKIGKDSDGDPYVQLYGNVVCRFTEAFNAKIARLQPGTAVAIHGTIVGLKSGEVVVKDCSF